MEILTDKEVKAIKPYKCEFCNGTIKKGEVYHYQSSVDSGIIDSFRSHIHCKELSVKFKMYDNIDESVGREIFEEVILEEFREKFPEIRTASYPEMALKLKVE